MNQKALEYLKSLQESHSKAVNLSYNDLDLQEYLCPDSNMTNKEKAFAFAARSHMLDLKGNFKYGKDNINCSLGCNQMEDQPHLLSCPVINSQQETNDYSDLFGTNPEKTELITKKLMIKFNEFKTTVHRQSQPNAASTDNIDDNNVNIDVIHVVELDFFESSSHLRSVKRLITRRPSST